MDEVAERSVVAEVSPAEDRADQAEPPRVLAAELDGDVEGLIIGEEPVLRANDSRPSRTGPYCL